MNRMREYVSSYPDDKEAHFHLGVMLNTIEHDIDGAITEVNIALELDPSYKDAYNALAYFYDEKGETGKSIESINRYIALAPDEANPYDTRGDLYAKHGRLREAIESYARAEKIKPDFYPSIQKLGESYAYDGNFDEATRCVRVLLASGDPGTVHSARLMQAKLESFRGRLDRSLKMLDEYLKSLPQSTSPGMFADVHAWRRLTLDMMHRPAEALKASEQVMRYLRLADPNAVVYTRGSHVSLLAQNGEVERAKRVLKELREDIDREHSTDTSGYWYATGMIERAAGNPEAAVRAFKKVSSPGWVVSPLMLGRTLLKLGRPSEAVQALRGIDTLYYGTTLYYRRALISYELGRASEAAGDNPSAVRRYEMFLKFVDGGDTDLPEIVNARKRLSKLKTGA